MPFPHRFAALILAAAGLAAGAQAAQAGPAVVELFTSQGCSSCPPADANLGKIADRPDVLALSFGVTYWDYLGWQDTFGKQEFTARQHGYARALGNSSVYTPQMVINGKVDIVGQRLSEVEEAITAQGQPDTAEISLDEQAVTIAGATAPGQAGEIQAGEIRAGEILAGEILAGEVWLVRYEPGPIEIPVARGENGGRKLVITHAVRELTRLGNWDGSAATFALPPGDAALKRAVLLQAPANGVILAAASD